MNERNLAITALKSINDGMFIDDAIKRVLADKDLEKRQRAFVKILVYGVVENRIYLDYAIDKYSNTKTKKMSTIIRLIIELGAYQLLFVDSIPARAVINESVNLVKKRKINRLTGFVNAVLRKIDQNKNNIDLPKNKLERISVEKSIPLDLLSYLFDILNEDEFESFVESVNDKTSLSIRCNLSKIAPEKLKAALEKDGLEVADGEVLNYSFKLSNYDNISSIYGFKEGFFQVQDESSTMVGEIIKSLDVKTALDLCAAPGGKSTHIAESDNLSVLSCDVSEKKIALIDENIERLGLKNINTKVNDASIFNPDFHEAFDLVLADVPCSGLGVIRKKPDIKYNVNSKSIHNLVSLQREIINNAVKYVKKSGYLVYSTCTITSEENQNNVAYILEKNNDFTLQNIGIDGLDNKDKYLRLMPKKSSYDGFFIALLKRE